MGIKSAHWKQMRVGAGDPYAALTKDGLRVIIRQSGRFVKALEFPTEDERNEWVRDHKEDYIFV